MTRVPRALAAIVLLAVAGCSGQADGDPGNEPSRSTSASPTASASPTLAPPTMPAAAREFGAKGAAAFVEYWYATQRYAAISGDTDSIRRLSSESCAECKSLVGSYDDLHAAGGYYEDLPWVATVTASQAESDYFVVTTIVRAKRYRYREVADGPFFAVPPQQMHHLIRVGWADEAWKVLLLADQARAS